MEKLRICKYHGQTVYLLNSQKKWICKQCRTERTVKHRQKIKRKSIEYKGGKCEKCGYNKCVYALDFHHVDKTTKDFGISVKTLSWERTKKELDKCILICSNCHRELHFEMGGTR